VVVWVETVICIVQMGFMVLKMITKHDTKYRKYTRTFNVCPIMLQYKPFRGKKQFGFAKQPRYEYNHDIKHYELS